MVVYLILLSFCMIFSYLNIRKKKSKTVGNYLVDILPFLFLFIVSAIRFNVGKDYMSYYNIYYFIDSSIRMDWGFIFIYKVLAFLHLTPISLFVVTSFIINFFVYLSIKNISRNQLLSYYIYVCGTLYFFSFNGIRQTIAMVMFYYSLKYIKEKRIKKYLIINIIATLIHGSAILFIPLYFILDKNISLKKQFLIVILTFLFSHTLLPYIIEFINGTKYAMYMVEDAYQIYGTFSVSSIINFILILGYGLLKKKDREDYIYSNCHLLGGIISVFLPILPLANRLFISFRYIEFLSIPNLISKMKLKKRNQQILIFIVVVLYFVYFIYSVYINNSNNVLPYNTIFNRR